MFTFLQLFNDLDEEADDDNDHNDDTETPDPLQTQIPSRPGIKYLVRGIPPSDFDSFDGTLERKWSASPSQLVGKWSEEIP